MNYTIREATESDLPLIAQDIRGDDLAECIAFTGSADVLTALKLSLKGSDKASVGVTQDGKPAVIWGHTRITTDAAIIWAIGTVHVYDYKVAFLRTARKVLSELFEADHTLKCLINFTYGKNTLHHTWLRWSGAKLLPPVKFGVLGKDFLPFVIWRESFCALTQD